MLLVATASFYSANFFDEKDIRTRGCHIRDENMSIEYEEKRKNRTERKRDVAKEDRRVYRL